MSRLWIFGVMAVLLLVSLTFVMPRWLVRSELQPAQIERRRLQNEIVRTAIQILGGGFFLATTILAWRQFQNSQQELDAIRQGQITERFTRAIDQIGSEELQVRVGGIYALEGIAKDSPRDYYRPVMEVLAAFLRSRAPVPDEPLNLGGPGSLNIAPAVDVQAALTVFHRRAVRFDPLCDSAGTLVPCGFDLSDVDLSGANLYGTHFEHWNFVNARLAAADLRFADLRGAFLRYADLQYAQLAHADLTKATLELANLTGANLELADLTGATLYAADLTNADLQDAEVTCDQLTQAIVPRRFLRAC